MQPADWVRVDDLESEAEGAVARGRRPPKDPASDRGGRSAPISTRREAAPAREPGAGSASPGDDDVHDLRGELTRAVGANKALRYEQRMKDATRAFRAERYSDAARILRQLAEQAPSAAAVRELYGLTLYRMGRWRPAIRELEAFHTLTSSTEQHPVLADCYRAIRIYDRVDELWDEVRAASPSAEIVTEGRIVYAGAQLDRGDVAGAIHTLEHSFAFPKRAMVHHLRRAYALADAYERAGDLVRARELFTRVAEHDREFADVVRRIRTLR